MRIKHGQSTLEYTLILAAIIAAIIAASGHVQQKVTAGIQNAGDVMANAAGRVNQAVSSIPNSNSGSGTTQ